MPEIIAWATCRLAFPVVPVVQKSYVLTVEGEWGVSLLRENDLLRHGDGWMSAGVKVRDRTTEALDPLDTGVDGLIYRISMIFECNRVD